MSNALFSTYRQGENRVTSTILAVLERLSFPIVEYILEALLQEPTVQLVSFQNQVTGPGSVPDGRIYASFSYWLEVKTEINALRERQIHEHLKAVDDERSVNVQRLIVLTPDPVMPRLLERVDDKRIAWANFQQLVDAIEDVVQLDETWLRADKPIPTERERELLRELVRFLLIENLVRLSKPQVLVVAARIAYDEYLRHGLYFCQPNRTFQPCTHMGFYAQGQIQPKVPKILASIESIQLDEEAIERTTELPEQERQRLKSAVALLRSGHDERISESVKVLFLSAQDSPETLTLPQPIVNDLRTESGRTVAFVQGQRYVSFEAIQRAPGTTSGLIRLSESV